MKKIVLMLAFLISVGMVTGCGDDSSSDEKSSSSSQVQESDNADESLSSSSQVQENDTEDENSSSNEAQSDSNTEFERGSVENGVYTSDFANVKFTAPDGWEFANDEYIATMMNLGLEVTENNNDLTKAMLEQTTIYDAMCLEQSTGKNLIFMFENLAKEVPDPSKFTVEDYASALDQQFSSAANVSVTNKSDIEHVTLNGEDYIKQTYTINYETLGAETKQTYYARKIGNYVLGIIASPGSTSDDMSVYEENFNN